MLWLARSPGFSCQIRSSTAAAQFSGITPYCLSKAAEANRYMKQGRVAALAARFGKKESPVSAPAHAALIARPASPGDVDEPLSVIVQDVAAAAAEKQHPEPVSLRFRQNTITVEPPIPVELQSKDAGASPPEEPSSHESGLGAKLTGDWNVRGVSESSGPFEYSLVLTAGIDQDCLLGSTDLSLEVDGFLENGLLTLFIKDEILMKTNTCKLTVATDHTMMEGAYTNNQGGKGTITLANCFTFTHTSFSCRISSISVVSPRQLPPSTTLPQHRHRA